MVIFDDDIYIYNVILIDDMYQGDNDFCWWPYINWYITLSNDYPY